MLTIIRVQTFLIVLFFPMFLNAQSSNTSSITTLNQFGALELANQVNKEAFKLDKKVSLAILGASGEVILLLKGDGLGPHNTKASER